MPWWDNKDLDVTWDEALALTTPANRVALETVRDRALSVLHPPVWPDCLAGQWVVSADAWLDRAPAYVTQGLADAGLLKSQRKNIYLDISPRLLNQSAIFSPSSGAPVAGDGGDAEQKASGDVLRIYLPSVVRDVLY